MLGAGTKMAARRNAQGFTLIELLVAVVIMAIGILGVAGLQVVSLQQNRSALFRSEAVQLANDLIDRIRVNPTMTYSALIDAAPASVTDCEAGTCTPSQMAAYDITQWKCSINSEDSSGAELSACSSLKGLDGASAGIKGELPDGAGSVVLTGGVYEIKIRWVDERDGTTASITVNAQVN
ncbi:MAG TPA: type IV pilus modification protein PilV [Pseudomonadales bacterium]|nr:type IV pilus modification protein PilV [Pseudomonadales bacterium]